jgi:hypothetical protein
MKNTVTTIALLCLSFSAFPLSAQVKDDDVSAFAASLPAIMAKIPHGPTALVHNAWNGNLAQRIVEQTGKKIDLESSWVRCREGADVRRNTCSLEGVASLVILGSVSIAGDVATVIYDIALPTSSTADPIEHYLYQVDLKRAGAAWVVVGMRQVGIS